MWCSRSTRRAATWPGASPTAEADAERLRIVVPRYGAEVVGGSEALAAGLATSLVAAGWQVEVLTTCAVDEATWANRLPAGRSLEEGVAVNRHPVARRRRPVLFGQLSRGFFRLPARLRPEGLWVAAQGPVAPGLIAELRTSPPVPTLFTPYLYHPTLAGLPAARGPRLLIPAAHDELPLRLPMVAAMLTAADGLLYGTLEERRLLEAVHPEARHLPAEVGTTGLTLDLDGIPPTMETMRHHGLRSPYLLYAGRDVAGKGVDELIAGAALLRRDLSEVSLALVGDAAATRRATPGVVAVGRVPQPELRALIAGSVAVVTPSFHESLSLLALEAWAQSRPLLANGASPVLRAQLARSGGGLLYRGAAELADAARQLLADPARALALGVAGHDFVAREYRWEDVHARLRRLIAAARPR